MQPIIVRRMLLRCIVRYDSNKLNFMSTTRPKQAAIVVGVLLKGKEIIPKGCTSWHIGKVDNEEDMIYALKSAGLKNR